MLRTIGIVAGIAMIAVGVYGGLTLSLDGWGYLLGLAGVVLAGTCFEHGRPSKGDGGGGTGLQTGREAGPYGDAVGGGDGGGGS